MKLLLIIFSIQLSWCHEEYLHVSGQKTNNKWSTYTSDPKLNIKYLIHLLAKSPSGEHILKAAQNKAKQFGQTLEDIIEEGHGSFTDTTLIRKFSPDRPMEVIYETKSKVMVNRDHNLDDALLDLAHELTHYSYREEFNPYHPRYNPKDFIVSTIEGRGGEVEAFLVECQVQRELFGKNPRKRSHCEEIVDNSGNFSQTLATKLFYHVGDYYKDIYKMLSKKGVSPTQLPELSENKINFVSSAYGVPYPLAALKEYEQVVNRVCQNDLKRLAYMQQSATRSPASVEKFTQQLKSRCDN